MKRIPCATYRLQFNREFTFRQAAEILEYLADLGISDIYASPLFEAGPQSTHGYDICCFSKLNPNLGTVEDFDKLTAALKERGLGLVLDMVPNHMSATLSNPWWFDVLQNGRDSAFAGYFDIDWRPNNPALQDKVVLPVLEDYYGKVLEGGKLRLTFQEGKFLIAYYDRNFPLNQATLPAGAIDDPKAVLAEFNGTEGNAHSFDKLDALIQRQHYRLAHWKVAAEEINYRRFFDVTEMVALKMELPEVFHATHELVFEWLAAGKITGLRIDHPDGLWNPKEYLERLQKSDYSSYVVVEKILSGDEALQSDWAAEGTTGYDFLNRVNGLFVNASNASTFLEIYREFTGSQRGFPEIVYSSRKQVLERAFASEVNALTHRLRDISARARSARDFTFSELRAAAEEIVANFPVYRTYITEASSGVSEQDRKVIQKAMQDARAKAGLRIDKTIFEFIERLLLLEVANELDEAGQKSAREWVMKFQQLTGPAMAKGLEDTAFYQFNRLISLNEVGGDPGKFGVSVAEFHEASGATAKHWPNTMLASATHDTKRGEDARARINVLSEMPLKWHDALIRWSQYNRDKKTVVGNAPAPDVNDEYLFYQTLVGAWPIEADTGAGLKAFCARVAAFMLKAVKEAKTHTSWTTPNEAYEKALRDFVGRVLAEDGNKVFVDDVRRFSGQITYFSRFNSLGQVLLKIASPGMPDFYQGSELLDLNLVDPDNRRVVDYAVRRKLLAEVKKKFEGVKEGGGEFPAALLKDADPGAMKLFLIWRALSFRGAQRELFDRGEYVPLPVTGEKQDHVCAFSREWNGRAVIIVVPRFTVGLTRGLEAPPTGSAFWKQTDISLPHARAGIVFRNMLTRETVTATKHGGGAVVEVGQVLKSFPVALLEPAGQTPALF